MKVPSRRVSVCSQPRSIPATVHPARFDQVDVLKEIADVAYAAVERRGVKGRAKEMQAAMLIGEVRAQLKSFAKGMLPEGRDQAFEAVVSQPDLWEVRVDDRRFGKFRSYHAEPKDGAPDIVVLRFHRKAVESLSTGELAAEQNRIMREAQGSYEAGRPQRWGHVDHCPICIEP